MNLTRSLALAELTLRVQRETEHARIAMATLGRIRPWERIRRPGRVERADTYHWKRVKRHLRAASKARAQLQALQA